MSRLVHTGEAARLLGIHRETLDAMVSRAPRTLAGAPVKIGSGKTRTHWRWNPDRLAEWLDAFKVWDSTRRASRGVRRAA